MNTNMLEDEHKGMKPTTDVATSETDAVIAATPRTRKEKEVNFPRIDLSELGANCTKCGPKILGYLRKMVEVAMVASTVNRCRVKRFKVALMSATFIVGSIDTLRRIVEDSRMAQTARIIAMQLIETVFPTEYSLVPRICIPYRKGLFGGNIVGMSDEAVEAAVKTLHATSPNPADLTLCKGFHLILKSAKADMLSRGMTISSRVQYLIDCCLRIEDAVASGNYAADIGFVPLPKYRQMLFEFLKEAC